MADSFSIIKLPKPRDDGGASLMKCIKERKSAKDYTPNKDLSLQQISELLYCAYGYNSKDHRTIASAMTIFPLEIYVILPKGIYSYDAYNHTLNPLKEGNYMEKSGKQDYVKNASMTFLFFSNTDKWSFQMSLLFYKSTAKETRDHWANIEVGFACQNIYLYCTSENLKTCSRAWCDGEYFKKELGLPNNYRFILAQSVGI